MLDVRADLGRLRGGVRSHRRRRRRRRSRILRLGRRQYFRPLVGAVGAGASTTERLGAYGEYSQGQWSSRPWPGEQWLSVARNCCRGATGMRSARVNSWRDPRLGALVLTKMLVSYVMGTDMPATDMDVSFSSVPC